MILAFDTETTGKAFFNLHASHASQPRLVQIGAILVDDSDDKWITRGELNLIIRPDGFKIPEEASAVHGITQEIAEQCGVNAEVALSAFRQLAKPATCFVCHNLDFDNLIMSAFAHRIANESGMFAHMRTTGFGFCTMKAMVDFCKIPGNYDGFKWPKLSEAYWHAFQEEIEGAHDAMVDVRACLRLFRWIRIQNGVSK